MPITHFLFRQLTEKRKKGTSLEIVMWVTISIIVFVVIIDLPEFLTILSGTTVTIPFLSNIDFKDKLNAFLTFIIAIFTIMGSYSTYRQVEIAQGEAKVDDVRNELEKLYGPVYSVLKKVVYAEGKRVSPNSTEGKMGILLPREKNIIDEKFSTYPYMNEELYQDWNKNIISIEKTMPNFENLVTLYEKLKGLDIMDAGVYLIPEKFISRFFKKYDNKVHEYRQLIEAGI